MLAIYNGMIIAVEQIATRPTTQLTSQSTTSSVALTSPITPSTLPTEIADSKPDITRENRNRFSIALMVASLFLLGIVELTWRFSSVLPQDKLRSETIRNGAFLLLAALAFLGAGLALYEIPTELKPILARDVTICLFVFYLLTGVSFAGLGTCRFVTHLCTFLDSTERNGSRTIRWTEAVDRLYPDGEFTCPRSVIGVVRQQTS